jgi:hypothetical protein
LYIKGLASDSSSGPGIDTEGLKDMYYYGNTFFDQQDGTGGSFSYFTNHAGFYNDSRSITEIKVVTHGCQYRSVTADDEFYFNGYDGAVLGTWWAYLSHLVNTALYIYGWNFDFRLIDTDTGKAKKWFSPQHEAHIEDNTIHPLSYNTFYSFRNGVIKGYKFDYATLTGDAYGYSDINNATWLFSLENVNTESGRYGIWIVSTLDGEIEYTLVLKEVNGERIPVVVKLSEYAAEKQQVITLKPINR